MSDGAPNIPLPIQKKLLHSSFYDTAEWIREMLDDDDFMADLEKMAEMRLEENFKKYGSAMYGWSADELFRNEMEELADTFNYKSAEGTP